MSVEQTVTPRAAENAPKSAVLRRPWLLLSLAALYWGVTVGLSFIDVPYFFRFLFGMAAPALFLLLFSVWWWTNRTFTRADRWLGFLLLTGGVLAAAPLTHPSIGISTVLMVGVPVVLTLWTLWIAFARQASLSAKRVGAIALALATWGGLSLFRNEGVDGNLRADLHWRWTPTAEELFLAQPPAITPASSSAAEDSATLRLSPGDWPEFRGPNREGIVQGAEIETDWSAAPPHLVWKQRIGPAWSSLIVIGSRLYTQEQRGEQEVVVCYDAATGAQLWAHDDAARFWDAVSGAGPRATPTFANGRIYTLGATGILNCLDATTGQRFWSHDLKSQAAATIPMWGLSGSPLIAGGLVVVYGGGENQSNLLAFDAETGAPSWTAAAGGQSYSSPQLVPIGGVPQVLMLTDGGLAAVEPATGAPLWHAGAVLPGAPRMLQPHLIDAARLFVGSLQAFSASLIDVVAGDGGWTTSEVWTSAQVKPEFSEFVVHDGNAYGFDGAIFCCLELETGKRRWKGGRYGRGQVILLADQGLLLVLSETGEAVLVAARPEKHHELARFEALHGKTWNHPVIAHGRLYARNAEEIACYNLSKQGG
ncbi:MAG: outer membrane protein assembly factor BamB family protein [Planctomycetaceae bacterium]